VWRLSTPKNTETSGERTLATDLDSSEGGMMARSGTGTDAPTRELPTAPLTASGDRCNNCGAPLAHDQRYCVECGEPRGQSSLPQAKPTAEVQSSRRRSTPAPRPTRVSSGTTLVAGVGVLLLAIGLGVLIGRLGNNNNPSRAAAPAQVISVQGGGGTATGAATTAPTTTSATSSPTTKKTKLKAAAKATAPPPAAVQKKATQAAGKVLGNGNHLAPPTVTTGGSCSNSQAGCSGGKFSGNFFGQ
jgi:hypothetical protein